MLTHRAQTHGEYLTHVQKHPQELDSLFSDLLIGVTRFFRDPEAFAFLQSAGFPALIRDRPPSEGPIRVWVAGCSGGEETYTVAMLLLEFLGERASETEIQIFATDLSERSIKRARAGVYPLAIEADVSPERLERFFVREDAGYRIKRSVRDLCVFATHNVAKDPPFSQLDLIVCRNVLIYFDPKLQDAVMPTFHYSLKPRGLLMLGAAESASPDYFQAVDKHHRIFRPKGRPAASGQRLEMDLSDPTPAQREGQSLLRAQRGTPIVNLAQQDADRLALARFAPPAVLVNERLDIVQLRGDTSGLLRLAPGTVSLHLFKVAHPDLLPALKSTVDAVRDGSPRAREENVMLRERDTLRQMAIEVIPFQSGPDGEPFYLVAFESTGPEVAAPVDTRSKLSVERSKKGKARPRRAPLIEEVAQLREQLELARVHLQDVVEQYEATTEELRAASEEIQSSNEELRHRNQDLAATSADLANVFASTQIPILIVSADMRIRRFTPVTDRVAKVIRTDVGRPIGDIKFRVDYPNLEEAITNAIASLQITHAEVKDAEGLWWSLTVRPYLTVDRKVDGAVVVFTDIDASKRSGATAEETSESRRLLLVAAETARAEAVEANKVKTSFMANISHDLRTPLNAIAGYVDLLQMEVHGVLSAHQHEDLNRIKQSSRHLISLINDILNFVQIDSGRLEFHLSDVPVKRAIERLHEMLAPQLQAKGLSFETATSDAVAFADEEKMQQILINLGTNAIKFTDAGGISISGDADPAMVRIKVADTGRGIPPDQLRRVFEPFIQVGRGLTNMNSDGVGLGLAIARDLARQMGGDVTVESEIGQGSTFTVSLPRARAVS
jgi:two-component system CheB/CheR fusion protein